MIFGPIFRVELLTVGRRRRYFLLRALYALGLLIAIYAASTDMRHYGDHNRIEAYARFARISFAMFASIQLGCILLLTPAMVAGTIASEHERKTIDYLLTTQLSDSEIALGKFSARLLTLGMFLLAALPIVVMMSMFGGINPQMVLETFIYALLTLLATASLSLWISASSRYSRTAVTSAYLMVIVLCALPLPIMALDYPYVRGGVGWFPELCRMIIAWNPIVLMVSAIEKPSAGFSAWATPYYAAPAYGAFSLVCTLAAVRSIRRTYVKTVSRGVGVGPRFAWLKPIQLFRFRIGRYPMLWKELISQRNVLKLGWIGRSASVALFVGAYIGLGVAAYDSLIRDRRPHSFYTTPDPYGYQNHFQRCDLHEYAVGMGGAVGALALLMITSRAAGSVTSEKEQDSWLTLLSTPLEGGAIATAKALGAIYSVRYWYLFLGTMWACCLIRFPKFALVIPVLVVAHAALAWFCAGVGVLYSIVCKNSLRAIGGALLTVGFIGVGLPLLAMGLLDFLRYSGRDQENVMFFIMPITLAGWDEFLVRSLSTERSWYDNDSQRLSMLTYATTAYVVAGVLLSGFVRTLFEWLAGRIAATSFDPGRRPHDRPTIELPVDLEAPR